MANNGDLFGMLQAEDKLDGTNYPMWSYMMKHVLVAKQLWNIVVDVDRRPAGPTTSQSTITDTGSSSSTVTSSTPPTQEQLRWDGKDAQAHALIALSVKRHIVPHIRSCSTSKQAWDTLASLYAVRNEARVAYLRKQLEDVYMAENESVDVYVTRIKDLKEQLANIDEIISNTSLVSTLLKGLPESFQSFATTIRLVAKGNTDMYAFDEVVSLLLQEEQSRVNRSGLIEGTQALAISQKGKGKHGSAFGSSKPKPQPPSFTYSSNDGDLQKKKKCKYCRKVGHTIEECRKLVKRNEKKKESGMTISENVSSAKSDEANMAQDYWACVVTYHYDASLHSKCMVVSEIDSDWFFDSGASKHITSCKSFFASLKDAPKGGHVVCANNASYPIIGVGEIELSAANGGVVILKNVLYVPGIKKNLISVPLIAKAGLHVHFVDDKCMVHDYSNGDVIVMSGTLCNGLYRLDTYKRASLNALAVHTSSMAEMELWHARFGHLNFNSLLHLQKKDMVIGLPTLESIEKHACEGCILGKMHRASFPKDSHTHTTRKLQLVHSDVCGPVKTPSFGKHVYFVTFIDDATRHTWVYPMKAKNEVFSCFKSFLAMAENFSANKLLTLRTDRGGEYMSHEFNAFLCERGILHQCTVPYTPQQNGVAERKNRTLLEMARCMVKGKHLPNKFWMEAVMCANYVLNRCPTKALRVITPYEAWNGHKPMVSHMRVFGCLAYALVPSQQHHKLDDKAKKCIFVGYSAESKGYRLYHPLTDTIIVSRDVVFAENSAFPFLECKKHPTVNSQDVFDTLMPLFQSAALDHGHVDQPSESQRDKNFQQISVENARNVQPNVAENEHEIQPTHDVHIEDVLHNERMAIERSQTMPRWLKQTLQDSKLSAPLLGKTRSSSRHASGNFVDYSIVAIACNEEPLTFEDACDDPHWMSAMQSEMDSIHKNGTWELCELPKGKNVIGTRWVYKIKRKPDGSIDRYKARLVAKGYAQQYGIDYEETFAPTSRMTTIRTVVALAAQRGWKMHQLDIKTAFLNGDLQEEVYVKQPPGFATKEKEHMVCRLHKALYGLKQAPRAWYEKIHKHLIALGFTCSLIESTFYVRKDGPNLLVLVLYVDDILLTGSCDAKLDFLMADLQHTFEVTYLGLLSYYLGIQFVSVEGGMFMHQGKYVEKLLQRFDFEDCKPVYTPVETGFRFSVEDSSDAFDTSLYQQAVGCLIYACNTRPDIQYAVSQLSRFMHSPGTKHWQAVKRVFRYLRGTLSLGLFYGRDTQPCLHAFTDSDWAGCYDTRVSTSGNCFFFGNSCISWLSKKQPTVATSSCEAEYRAVFTATVECIWLRRLLMDLCMEIEVATRILTDSQSALAVARNPVFHARTKHIEVHYHYVRERFHAGDIDLVYVPTQDNVADIFTKALPREKFEAFRKALGLLPCGG